MMSTGNCCVQEFHSSEYSIEFIVSQIVHILNDLCTITIGNNLNTRNCFQVQYYTGHCNRRFRNKCDMVEEPNSSSKNAMT